MTFFDAVRARPLSKFVAALLTLSLLIVVGSLIAGITLGDMRGQLAFGLLAGCSVLTVSIPMALRVPLPVLRIIRFAWLTMTALVLTVGIVLGGEAGDTVLTYAMVVLSFPCSLVAAPLAGSILGGLTTQVGGLVVFWMALLCVGYVQWFVLLQRLLRGRVTN